MVTQSGTHSRNLSGTRPSVWTVSDGCLKRICSLDTGAFSALEVLTTTALYKFTYSLTYLLTLLFLVDFYNFCTIGNMNYYFTVTLIYLFNSLMMS